MENDPDRSDLEWLGALLDGALSPAEEEQVHERLRTEPAFRRKLADLIIVRSLLSVGDGPGARPQPSEDPRECAEVQALFASYRSGTTTESETARLSRHIADCLLCEASFEAPDNDLEHDAQPRATTRPWWRRRAVAVSAVAVLAAVVAWSVVSAGGSLAARPISRTVAAKPPGVGSTGPEAVAAALGAFLREHSEFTDSDFHHFVNEMLADPSNHATSYYNRIATALRSALPAAESVVWTLAAWCPDAMNRAQLYRGLGADRGTSAAEVNQSSLRSAVPTELARRDLDSISHLYQMLVRTPSAQNRALLGAVTEIEPTTERESTWLSGILVNTLRLFPEDAGFRTRFEWLLANGDPTLRISLAQLLAETDRSRAISTVLPLLGSPTARHRLLAAQTVMHYGTAAEREIASTTMANDPECAAAWLEFLGAESRSTTGIDAR